MKREGLYEDELYRPPPRGGFQEYLSEALQQAPWWLVSVAVHGVLGIVLTLAHFTEYTVDKPVVVDTDIENQEVEDPPVPLERDVFDQERDILTDQPPIEDPVISDAEIADHSETESNEDYESAKGIEDAISDKPFQGKYDNGAIGVGGGAGGTFGGRWGGRKNLRAYGGGPHTESAVILGLVWLKNHQNPDGMWSCRNFMMNCKTGTCSGSGSSDEYDMGVTGLAMLAFLGAGHTHRHGKFKNTVKSGLKAMVDRQTPDGCLGPKTADGHWIYNHAIATMALAEAYGLSNKSPLLQGPAQKAVDFLLDCQNPYLGWRYGRQTGENDTSVTGWAVLALKSAVAAKLHVPKEAFDGARNWLDKATDDAYYRTGYTSKGDVGARPAAAIGKFQPSEAMTAAAMASRIFMDGKDALNRPEILGAANLLVQNPPRWDVKGGTIDMYYWYYGSLAMFQVGRHYWKAWNEPMKNALVPTQKRGGCENGSWDPVGPWGGEGGRVYSTAINVLTLEIYYRYGRLLSDKK